ncbi:MAG: S46 family peptidase [Flavobacteriales bacterium]|nr:S46 family peptidase [Flavobacteriales bacterium]
MKNSYRLALSLFILPTLSVDAHEGMWVPTLLKSIESDLQSAGLQLSAEDVYSVNNGSIKDAILLFGGGCTAEVISREGLILTNHHCGFSAIADHSTVEQDYLKYGFWAQDKAAELRNGGLTATFVVRMEDVSSRVLPELKSGWTEEERRAAVGKIAEGITKEAIDGTHFQAVVRPFNFGNSYFLIVTETFRDVRLVGAPPSSIGKFGGDTDNWMWPRHNADFSMFRIYANADNLPADPAAENIPFTPRHVLPISLNGTRPGDFAMIYGFPGSTQRYLTSYAVDHVMNTADPMRIAMRAASLEVIDAAMRSSDHLRIQYADKQSGISNAYKKWIGELRGLKDMNTLRTKRAMEEDYIVRAENMGLDAYAAVLPELKELYAAYAPYATARDLFVELVYYGPELFRYARRFNGMVDGAEKLKAENKWADAASEELKVLPGYFDAHHVGVDKRILKAILPIYLAYLPEGLRPSVFAEVDGKFKGDTDAWVEDMYARSVLTKPSELEHLLQASPKKFTKTMSKDPAYRASQSLFDHFLQNVRPKHVELGDRIELTMRTYVKGMMEMDPQRTFWPDANSTLRLSYGKVEGSEPRDAVVYGPYSTLDGVIEKYIPGDVEFDVPERLLKLHAAKDYGDYGLDGTMPVCFTSSLHTTGGNSGSPVLNGRGELIGLNFDRTWESTMSDIQFDPDKCRNICVDVRYILFIVDKFAGAGNLIEEMTLIRTEEPRLIALPLHR